jgi:plastocyanin
VVRAFSLCVVLITACGAAAGSVPRATPTPTLHGTSSATAAPQSIVIPTDAAGAPVVVVWMGEHYYSPSTLTVPVGTTVMWWMLGQQEHDLWAYDGSFHSPTMGPGSKYTNTFTKVGTFRYFCAPHYGDGMTGQVIVVPRT